MATKYVRDPVHDVIEIECELTQRLIDTKVFQRLRRIKQLGLANFVYPGAEHTRFSHSLGAFHLAKKLVSQLSQNHPGIYEKLDEKAIPIAALCHDIGHGPFSHLFEKVIKEFVPKKDLAKHESWSGLILNTHGEVQKVFAQDQQLLDTVSKIVMKGHANASVVDVISSELDVDRLDYLLRDSHMSGVRYGDLDLAWILRSIRKVDRKLPDGKLSPVLAFDATRGLSVVESYILGRHYMYRHLYWYHTVRAAELMLKNFLQKIMLQARDGANLPLNPVLLRLAKSEVIGLDEYLSLDDLTIWFMLDAFIQFGGPFGDLAHRLKHRRIFKTIVFSPDLDTNKLKELIEKTTSIANKNSLDPNLYVIYDDPTDIAMKSRTFLKTKGEEHKYQPLYYFDKSSDRVSELNDSDNFASKISYAEKRLYVADEIYAEVKNLWN